MSGVRRDASVRPMSIGKATEWLPILGLSWQVVQVPWIVGRPKASLSPPTPVMAIGFVPKSLAPRAIAARFGRSWSHAQALKSVIASGSNGLPLMIRAEDVVDRDVEGLDRDEGRPSLGALDVELAGVIELLLGRREVELELHDGLRHVVGQGQAALGVRQGRVVGLVFQVVEQGRRILVGLSRSTGWGSCPCGANDSRPSHMTAVRKRRFVAGIGRRNSESSEALA